MCACSSSKTQQFEGENFPLSLWSLSGGQAATIYWMQPWLWYGDKQATSLCSPGKAINIVV